MVQYVREIMTTPVVAFDADATAADAAKLMSERDIGVVIVTRANGDFCGIVTDRDIVVRCIAQGKAPNETILGTICTLDVKTLRPDEGIDAATLLMRDSGVRRLPVEDDGQVIGIVSLGDLAQVRDPNSVLGTVSASPPNR